MWNAIKPTALGLTLTLGALAFAPNANASSGPNNAYTVSYQPEELSTPKQAENVISRIHHTANKMCIHDFGPERHSKKVRVKNCLKEVTQDLVDQIDHENLYMAHAKIAPPQKLDMRTGKKLTSYARHTAK